MASTPPRTESLPEATPPVKEATPPRPKAKKTPAPAPGDAYVFRPWHTALIFSLAFLLHVPFLAENAVSKRYPVLKTGAVLITGASTGIGRDAAVALAKKNYTIFAGARVKSDFDGLIQLSPNIHPVVLDLTSDRTIDAAYKTITKELSSKKIPFVGLINNDAIAQRSPVEYHAIKDIEKTFQVNVFGTIKLTQRFLPLLRESKGRIINLSSVLGKYVHTELATYSASKYALEAYSDGLRRELMPLDVSVTVIEPGFVKTPIHDKVASTTEHTSEEAKKVYPHLYTEKRAQYAARKVAKASPTKVVSTAIVDALTNPHPKARVAVANVDSVPASLLLSLFNIFPDRLVDYILHARS